MTLTHLSHFGLTEIGRSNENIVLEGSLSDCKRMAAAHGLEIVATEGPTIGMAGRSAITSNASVVRYLLTSGMIQKSRDGWALVMPLTVWTREVY